MATPTSASERIYTLDVIRGFALLGIFIMNMPWFNTSFHAGKDGTRLWPDWWDRWTETAMEVLFSGKFNSMFSMLFAIGFTIQLERLEARDPAHALTIYLRRIFWLFVFGAIHMCVFWTGDVLHVYALLGLLLLALRQAPERLLWTLFALFLLGPLGMGIYRYLVFTPGVRDYIVATEHAWEASNNFAYGQGSFLEALREHVRETRFYYTEPFALRGMIRFYTQVGATMMLGLIVGRRHLFQNAGNYLPQIARVQWWSLGGGLAFGAVFGVWQATTTDPITSHAVAPDGWSLLHPVPHPDHGLLRRDHRALRLQREVAPAARPHGHRGAHAVDQLPDANRDRHHVVLWLGPRPVGQGGPCSRSAVGPGDFLRGADTAEQVVAGPARARAHGMAVATADLRTHIEACAGA